jgi:hypothetical protein
MSSKDDPPMKCGLADALQIYGAYRDYIKHEDELIHQRLSWNLTLQGFLFTAYGLTFSMLSNPGGDPTVKAHLHFIHCVFPVVGGLVALLSLLSILAAQNSLNGLREEWLKHIDKESVEMLPGLTGAGRSFANTWGKMPQIGIPIVIVAAWCALLYVAITW